MPLAEVQYFDVRHRAQSLAVVYLCSLHSLCAGCITPGGRQLKSGFSDLKYLFVASHSFLCSPPAPCHDPISCTEPCTGASNSYSAQLQDSARDQVLGCDFIQGIFSRKVQFPAGTHTTDTTAPPPHRRSCPSTAQFLLLAASP